MGTSPAVVTSAADMAVLVEAISVVIRRRVIDERYPGGWDRFVDSAPNDSLCADAHLARLGFMQASDVEAFVVGLSAHGIHYQQNGVAQDLVVVDQQRGPLAKCDWIEFGRVSLTAGKNQQIGACRLVGDDGHVVATPDDWRFEGSLSQTFGFAPSGEAAKGLRFLRHEDGNDVYFSELTGKEVYVGRTSRG